MIHPDRLGHLVIKVRDLERSKKFYTEVMGLELMGEVPQFKIAFLAANRRDHHELGLLEVGPEADGGQFEQVGLLHFAFRMKSYEELGAAYRDLKSHGVKVVATTNHARFREVGKSLRGRRETGLRRGLTGADGFGADRRRSQVADSGCDSSTRRRRQLNGRKSALDGSA